MQNEDEALELSETSSYRIINWREYIRNFKNNH